MQPRAWIAMLLGRGSIVRGPSYDIAGRTLTPIARLRAFEAEDGRFEFRAVDPVAIVEEVGGSSRLIAIGDGWGRRAGVLALVATPVVLYLIASAIARSVRRSRPARKRR